MKKAITFVAVVAYSILANHCLILAAVPEGPGAAVFADREDTDVRKHAHCSQHSDSDEHNDKSKDEKPCCSNLSWRLPALIHGQESIASSLKDFGTISLLPVGVHCPSSVSVVYRTNHGPPGPPQQIFLSLASPRAPPTSSL